MAESRPNLAAEAVLLSIAELSAALGARLAELSSIDRATFEKLDEWFSGIQEDEPMDMDTVLKSLGTAAQSLANGRGEDN